MIKSRALQSATRTELTEPTTYAFVGGGNMGRALIGGLIAAGHPATAVRVADSASAARSACTETFGVEAMAEPGAIVDGADVIVLAVKPQQMREAALDIGRRTGTDDATLYVSIAAGITLDHLAHWLGKGRAIVRAMPNTPALIGCGATALAANPFVNALGRQRAEALLAAVGMVEWLDEESLLDAVTALSGSGPAYFFMFIEALEEAGAALGLPNALARKLALQTAYGATRLAHESPLAPGVLREQVTSPGGTTERALASFTAADFAAIVERALEAARDRSIELAEQTER